jgi:hypothetical protein
MKKFWRKIRNQLMAKWKIKNQFCLVQLFLYGLLRWKKLNTNQTKKSLVTVFLPVILSPMYSVRRPAAVWPPRRKEDYGRAARRTPVTLHAGAPHAATSRSGRAFLAGRSTRRHAVRSASSAFAGREARQSTSRRTPRYSSMWLISEFS